MQSCTACSDTCSPSSGGAGSLLPLLCGALFVFLVLIRASLNAAWAPPAPGLFVLKRDACAAPLWGHSALETSRALSLDCREA